MPLGLLGRWGGAAVAHGKHLIHTVVFSMPSNETNGTHAAPDKASATAPVPPMASAQAVPVLSFAGSGYDVTLIIMVSAVVRAPPSPTPHGRRGRLDELHLPLAARPQR